MVNDKRGNLSHNDYVQKNIETYDAMLGFFSTSFSKTKQSNFEKQCLENFLSKLEPNAFILDMACGVGKLTKFIHDRGFVVDGCDLSEVLINAAIQNNPDVNFTLCDIRNYCPSKCYDAIILSYCLFHFTADDIKKILRNIYGFTKDNARLHIVMYVGQLSEGFQADPINDVALIQEIVRSQRQGNPFLTYINLMGVEDIVSIAKECKYTVEDINELYCEKGIGFSDHILFLDIKKEG